MGKKTKSRAPIPGSQKEARCVTIVEAVRKSILLGELRPGDPVSELHLARGSGLSQTTVREALVKLEQAGLVRRIHNIGTFVTQMSSREVQERLRLRVMLEGLAAMEAARAATPARLAEIDTGLEALSQAIAADDHFRAAQTDLEFHRLIWRSSGDSTLYQILDQITVPLFAFISMERHRLHESLADGMQAHEPIVRALHARDAGAAQEAIRLHLETSYAEFLGPAQSYTLAIG